MQKISTLLILILSGLYITGCNTNNPQKNDAPKQDSLANDSAMSNNTVKSEFFIAPPDADYTGDYVDKYPNGVIKFTGFYRFGKRHGQWNAFYENGLKWSECFYDNGKKHGQSTIYFPNGNVQLNGWYKNDLQDSLWFFYDETKKEIDRRAFKNGVETGLVN